MERCIAIDNNGRASVVIAIMLLACYCIDVLHSITLVISARRLWAWLRQLLNVTRVFLVRGV